MAEIVHAFGEKKDEVDQVLVALVENLVERVKSGEIKALLVGAIREGGDFKIFNGGPMTGLQAAGLAFFMAHDVVEANDRKNDIG